MEFFYLHGDVGMVDYDWGLKLSGQFKGKINNNLSNNIDLEADKPEDKYLACPRQLIEPVWHQQMTENGRHVLEPPDVVDSRPEVQTFENICQGIEAHDLSGTFGHYWTEGLEAWQGPMSLQSGIKMDIYLCFVNFIVVSLPDDSVTNINRNCILIDFITFSFSSSSFGSISFLLLSPCHHVNLEIKITN